jgi:threonyl-tRNA synthetase
VRLLIACLLDRSVAGGLQEEAENERMHLLTALQLKQPGKLFKAAVWVTQGIFFNFFFAAYLVSPRYIATALPIASR